MNTILITGTVKRVEPNDFKYEVYIWGSKEGEPLRVFVCGVLISGGYDDLWKFGKECAQNYFKEPRMNDGAYTQFLEHIILIP